MASLTASAINGLRKLWRLNLGSAGNGKGNPFVHCGYEDIICEEKLTRKLSYRKDDRAMRLMYMGALKIFGSP